MKIVFFGTPHFAADVLNDLIDRSFNIVGIVTKPDKPQGRSGRPVPSPVKLVAQERLSDIPFFQPDKISAPDYAEALAALKADLFVVVAFGEIIKQHLLDMPRLGCINVHASLLPKYRGAAPIQRCIMQGEVVSGVTIMYLVRQMDAGDIITAVQQPIGKDMTAGELEERLSAIGKEALVKAIELIGRGTATRTSQDHSQATHAAKIELEDGEVKWERSAQELHNRIRGVTPRPGAWCFVELKGQKKRLKIAGSFVEKGLQGSPGVVLSGGREGLVIACGEDALRVTQLQLEGKKAVAAEEFCRGIDLSTLFFITK